MPLSSPCFQSRLEVKAEMVSVYDKAFHKKENQVLNPSSRFQAHILICDPVLPLKPAHAKWVRETPKLLSVKLKD